MSFGIRADDVWCDKCRDWIGFGNGLGRKQTNDWLAEAARHHGWKVKGNKAICPECLLRRPPALLARLAAALGLRSDNASFVEDK